MSASDYLAGLKDKRVNYLQHVRQINAQAQIFGCEAVARALADAHEHQAYAADYVINLLHARARCAPTQDMPLHVTRNADLLELDIEPPDLTAYQQDI